MPDDLLPADLPDRPSPALSGTGASRDAPPLTRPQKAAVIVRVLLEEGASLSLRSLPDDVQFALTHQMTSLRAVTSETVAAVIDEFLSEIDMIGLSFPRELDGALGLLGRALSPSAAARLRNAAGVDYDGDPWELLETLEPDRLLPALEAESIEIAAVILSKLKVSTAAALLGRMPGDRARRIAFAVSQIGAVSPRTVRRIGVTLVRDLDVRADRAFDDAPVARVGAILNSSTAGTRDEVLAGLDETDKAFAEEVRKAIFTFANIPGRLAPRDVPKVLREIDQADLARALASARGKDAEAAEFLLQHISQRMAENIRGEAAEVENLAESDSEAAMDAIVAAIRKLEADGEIFLTVEEE